MNDTEPDEQNDPENRERGEGDSDIETGHGGELLNSTLHIPFYSGGG